MRPALRLLQTVAANTASAGNAGTKRALAFGPTGITGIGTHPAPRRTLLTIYSKTLEALKTLPKDSAYRTAAESMTAHRHGIVDAVKPFGWSEHLDVLKSLGRPSPPNYTEYNLSQEKLGAKDVTGIWMSQEGYGPEESENSGYDKLFDEMRQEADADEFKAENPTKELPDRSIVNEPPLSVEQVRQIEEQIGGGLIEEIIMMAYSELQLVQVMRDAKVWEPLVEQPVEGQWKYFERKAA